MEAMRHYRFWFCLLPANMTYLMQPLDVQTFAQVKRFLRERFNSLPPDGIRVRLVLQALRDIIAAIRKFFGDYDWGFAFDSLGLNGFQPPYSSEILRELEWTSFPIYPRSRPTAEL